jgi:uncharacterized delta-60 repeat protein
MLFTLTLPAGAIQPGDLDHSFDPGSTLNNEVRSVAVQPDGKVLIAGSFAQVHGALRPGLARLNADGSTDFSFAPAAGGYTAVLLQPDGKVLVAGSTVSRLNPDGSLDPAFGGLQSIENPGFVLAMALQGDGKIVIVGNFTRVNGTDRFDVARLNPDGSLDTGFQNGMGGITSPWGEPANAVAIQPDGKVLIAGSFDSVNGTERHEIARLNADGSLDPTFQNGMAGVGRYFGGSYATQVHALALQPDGKVLIGGYSDSVNGVSRHGIARLNPDGSLDAAFQNGMLGVQGWEIDAIAVQSDGKVLIGGGFAQLNGSVAYNFARLNTDGSRDTGYTAKIGSVYSIALQHDGKAVIGGAFLVSSPPTHTAPWLDVARFNTNGTMDTNFWNGRIFSVDSRDVPAIAVQPDGKSLLAGLRLNSDGSPDTTFNHGTNGIHMDTAPIAPTSIAMQADGKVLIAGQFNKVNGVGRTNFARLNTNGTLDTAFAPSVQPFVNCMAAQPDGKIVIGGQFFSVNGVGRTNIARLNRNGSVDTTFQNGMSGASGSGNPFYPIAWVRSLALQTDGKVVIGGGFTNVNGSLRNGIARLNADGSLDTSFQNGLTGLYWDYGSPEVSKIVVLPGGKILIGGQFSAVNGTPQNAVARIHPDGSLDGSFASPLDPFANGFGFSHVSSFAVQGASTALGSHSPPMNAEQLTSPGAFARPGKETESVPLTFKPDVHGCVVSQSLEPSVGWPSPTSAPAGEDRGRTWTRG